MDYSYFNNTPQAYQYLGQLPTPGHSGSAVSSEDYSNSSPVRAPFHNYLPSQIHLAHPQSQEFHQDPSPHYSHSYSRSNPSYSQSPTSSPHYPRRQLSHSSGSPTSPLQYSPLLHSPLQHPSPSLSQAYLTSRNQQDTFDQFQTFDNPFNGQYTNGSANGLPKPAAVPLSQHEESLVNNGNVVQNGFDLNNASAAAIDANDDAARRGQSNSDDDDMTPAQSRRKAQNRAAQRAFRERKERHVKDLETKLQSLENASKNITEENARLKLQLQKAATENEILKATSSTNNHRSASPPTTAGPLRYSPTDFYTEVLYAHDNKVPSHRIVVSESGERLLAAGAAWDYIINHPLYKKGMVNVGDVSESLKIVARCDGQGPVFEERAIIEAIEKSVASGNDELL